MRVALFNDTAVAPHMGCQAVSDAHARMLGRQGHMVVYRGFVTQFRKIGRLEENEAILKALENARLHKVLNNCDVVIVNGEGTIHHHGGQHLLAILGAAQELGKPTLLVNSVFEATTGFDSVLRRLEDFTVRDRLSELHAKERGISCRLVWDSSLEASYSSEVSDRSTGKTIITDWHGTRSEDTGDLLRRFCDNPVGDVEYVPLQHARAYETWASGPSVFRSAKQVITGRHHGCYFCIKGRQVFIPLGSNTFKIEGLVEMSGVPIPIPSTWSQLCEALEWLSKSADLYDRLFDKAEEQLPLSTFRVLGQGTDSDEATELSRLQRQRDRAEALQQKLCDNIPDLWSAFSG